MTELAKKDLDVAQRVQNFTSIQNIQFDDRATTDRRQMLQIKDSPQYGQELDQLFILQHSITAKDEKIRLLNDGLARSNRERDVWKCKVEQIVDDKIKLQGEIMKFSTYHDKILSPIANIIQQIESELHLIENSKGTADDSNNIYALPRRLETCYHALKIYLYQPMPTIYHVHQTPATDDQYVTSIHHDTFHTSTTDTEIKKTSIQNAVQIESSRNETSLYESRQNSNQAIISHVTDDNTTQNKYSNDHLISQTNVKNESISTKSPSLISQTNSKFDNIDANLHCLELQQQYPNVRYDDNSNIGLLKKQLQEKTIQVTTQQQYIQQQDKKLSTCKVLQGTMGVEIAKYTTDIANLQRQIKEFQPELTNKRNKIAILEEQLQHQQHLFEDCRLEIQTLLHERKNLLNMIGKLQSSLGIPPKYQPHDTNTYQKSRSIQQYDTKARHRDINTIHDTKMISVDNYQVQNNSLTKDSRANSDVDIVMERLKAYQKDLDIAHQDLVSKGQTHSNICKAAFKMQKQITNMRKEIDALLTRLDWLEEERETLIKEKLDYQTILKNLKDRLKQSNIRNDNLKAEIALARGEIDFKEQLIGHLRIIMKQGNLNGAAIISVAENWTEKVNHENDTLAQNYPTNRYDYTKDIDTKKSHNIQFEHQQSQDQRQEKHKSLQAPLLDVNQRLLRDIETLRQQQLQLLREDHQLSSTTDLVMSSLRDESNHNETSISLSQSCQIVHHDDSRLEDDTKLSTPLMENLKLPANFGKTTELTPSHYDHLLDESVIHDGNNLNLSENGFTDESLTSIYHDHFLHNSTMNEVKKWSKRTLHQDVYQRLRLRLKTLQQMGGQLEEDNLELHRVIQSHDKKLQKCRQTEKDISDLL